MACASVSPEGRRPSVSSVKDNASGIACIARRQRDADRFFAVMRGNEPDDSATMFNGLRPCFVVKITPV